VQQLSMDRKTMRDLAAVVAAGAGVLLLATLSAAWFEVRVELGLFPRTGNVAEQLAGAATRKRMTATVTGILSSCSERVSVFPVACVPGQGEIMAKRLAPLTGVLFFLLLLAAVVVGSNSLSASSSPAKVLAYYQAHQDKIGLSGGLTVLSVVVGVIFYGQLRDYLRRHEGSRGWTATAFGGVLLFAASGALSAGAAFALTDSPSHLSAAAAQILNLINTDISNGLALAGIALLFICFGRAILNGGLLPTWLGWIAFPLALIALIPPVGFFAFAGAGLWTLIVSIAMWRRISSETAAVTEEAASTPA